jgi:uncharacterized protein
MHFEGTADIGAPRERVWEFVTDAQRVSRCGPDVQRVDVIDATHFKVVARAGVGAIRTTFALDVVFTELRAPEHASVRARGQAPGSAVEMTNTLDLADAAPGRTTLRWASEVTVSGMIASVGARLMQGAADKVTQQVFSCIKEQLDSPAAST